MDNTNYEERYQEFINNTKYYKTSMHSKYCKICKLPKDERNKIDAKILNGEDPRIIVSYLHSEHPDIFRNHDNTSTKVKNHIKYLPYLLEDVAIKHIFKRARAIIENKDISALNPNEKAKIITEIENEIIKEYEDLENERLSMLNFLFKETMPMILERLHREIIDGKAREIKDIAEAGNIIFKLTTAMSVKGVNSGKEEKEEKVDFSNIEGDSNTSKENVLSLTERIKKATDGRS